MSGSKRRYQAIYFVFFAAGNGIFAYRNAFFEDLGLSGSQMGVIGAAMVGAGMVAQPVWGALADRYGATKRILVTGAVVSGVAAFLFPVAGRATAPFLLLAAAGVLFSAFRAPITPITNAMVLESGLDYGRVRAFGSIAFGLGVFGLGGLIASFGTPVVFYLYVVGMGVFLFALYGLREPDVEVAPDLRRDAASLLGSRPFLLLLAVAVVVGGADSAASAFFSVYVRAIGAGDELTGVAWLVKTAAEAGVFLTIAALGLSHTRQLSLGIGAYTVTFVVLAATGFVPAVVAVQLLYGVGFALFTHSSVSLAHRFSPDALASTGQTVLTGVGLGAGRALGQLVSGRLVDVVGVRELYVFLAAGAAAACLLSLGFHVRGLSTAVGREVRPGD